MRGVLVGILVVGLATAESAGAACAPQTPRQLGERAPVILTGVVESGPVTPAKIRVEVYDKGKGPAVIDVDTGIYDDAAFGESIAPQPGERWRIYGQWHGGTLITDSCWGSHEITAAQQAPAFAFGRTAALGARSTFAGRIPGGSLPRLTVAPGKRSLRVSSWVQDVRLLGARGGVKLKQSKGLWTLRVPTQGRPGGTLVADTGDAFYAVRLQAAARRAG